MNGSIHRSLYACTIVLLAGVALALSVAIVAAAGSVPGRMESSASGFGRPENYHAGAPGTLGGRLHAGTWNDEEPQAWRTAGGRSWNPIIPSRSPTETVVYVPVVLGGHGCLGELNGTIVDATTAEPLANVLVTVGGTGLSDATGADGGYSIPAVPSGVRPVTAALDGYVSISQNINIGCDRNTLLNFALSPNLSATEMRIVLTWGEAPRDLDAHLWLPSGNYYHICWFSPGSLDAFPFAHLDVDDTTSYGPETITIKQWYPGAYSYAVNKWSEDGDLTTSGARVQVYKGANLVAAYDAPTSGSGRWWYVLNIDGTTHAVTNRDYLTSDPPYDPYPCIMSSE